MRNPEERRSSLELLTPNVPLPVPQKGERIQEIRIDLIIPNERQVRTHFAEDRIRELADSIQAQGILSPLVLRPAPESLMIRLSKTEPHYELVAGERRWRALKLLGRTVAPSIVREVPDSQMRLLALIENVQREDLGVLEKAKSILDLKSEFGAIEKVASAIHKSRGYAFMLARIGELDPELQTVIQKNELSTLEANTLAGLVKDAEKLGNEKIEYALKRSLLTQPVTAKLLQELKQRYFGDSASKSASKSAGRSTAKTFWKTKKAYGLQLKVATTTIHDAQVRNQLVKDAKRFFEALGARKFDVQF